MSIKADELYGYLLKHPDRWISQEEICAKLPDYFAYKNPINGTTVNRKIWDVVEEINQSLDEYTMIVVTKKRQYKIATKEEAVEYLKREFSNLGKKARRLNQIKYKLKLDGIADLTSLLTGDQLDFLETTLKKENYDEN